MGYSFLVLLCQAKLSLENSYRPYTIYNTQVYIFFYQLKSVYKYPLIKITFYNLMSSGESEILFAYDVDGTGNDNNNNCQDILPDFHFLH